MSEVLYFVVIIILIKTDFIRILYSLLKVIKIIDTAYFESYSRTVFVKRLFLLQSLVSIFTHFY